MRVQQRHDERRGRGRTRCIPSLQPAATVRAWIRSVRLLVDVGERPESLPLVLGRYGRL